MWKINLLATIDGQNETISTTLVSDSPSVPTHTLQTWNQRFLFAVSAVWVWSEVPAPEYQLSSHSWRCTWTEGCVIPILLNDFSKKPFWTIYEEPKCVFKWCSRPTSSPVEPEKNEVSLVVEGDHLSAQKLWVLGEEGSKQSSDAVTQTCGEVVQNHLRIMFCWIFAPSLRKRKHSVTLLCLEIQR